MRKLAISMVALCVAFALAAAAAPIDGKWTAEVTTPAGKKGGEAQVSQVTLDLKSSGSQLTGTVAMGKRGKGTEITDGKIEGNQFSFSTVQKTKKGEAKLVWKGTLEGDQLKGERGREGARRMAPFTAKRQ